MAMKLKLEMIVFPGAVVIAGLLMLGPFRPSSSNPTGEPSSPEATQKPTGSSATANLHSKPSSEPVAVGRIKLSAKELAARIQDAMKADPVDYRLAFGDLLRDLIGKDPRAATRLAGSLAVGPVREEMMRRLAQYWTEQDAPSAKQWAEQLADVGERNSALTDVCFQMAQSDPRQAALLADHYGLGELPGAPLESLVMQWAVKDLTSATAWVKDRPEGERKNDLLARVAMVMARTSPAEAAEMVATQLPEGNAQTESVISVLHQWAIRDLPEARAWTELFPEGQLRERALGELKGVEQYQRAASSQSTR
jgi:hypothetical protein